MTEVEFAADLPPPPPWQNAEEVAAWANRMLVAIWNEEEYEFSQLRWETHPGIRIPRLSAADWERIAVDAAKDGDFRSLANLLEKQQTRETLTQAAWELIAERLTEGDPRVKFFTQEPKIKRKRGRRQMPADQRRALYPVHDAADLVPQVEFILGKAYPDQPGKQIRDRALYVIEHHTEGKVSVRMLANYLGRAKSDRRRTGP